MLHKPPHARSSQVDQSMHVHLRHGGKESGTGDGQPRTKQKEKHCKIWLQIMRKRTRRPWTGRSQIKRLSWCTEKSEQRLGDVPIPWNLLRLTMSHKRIDHQACFELKNGKSKRMLEIPGAPGRFGNHKCFLHHLSVFISVAFLTSRLQPATLCNQTVWCIKPQNASSEETTFKITQNSSRVCPWSGSFTFRLQYFRHHHHRGAPAAPPWLPHCYWRAKKSSPVIWAFGIVQKLET